MRYSRIESEQLKWRKTRWVKTTVEQLWVQEHGSMIIINWIQLTNPRGPAWQTRRVWRRPRIATSSHRGWCSRRCSSCTRGAHFSHQRWIDQCLSVHRREHARTGSLEGLCEHLITVEPQPNQHQQVLSPWKDRVQHISGTLRAPSTQINLSLSSTKLFRKIKSLPSRCNFWLKKCRKRRSSVNKMKYIGAKSDNWRRRVKI